MSVRLLPVLALLVLPLLPASPATAATAPSTAGLAPVTAAATDGTARAGAPTRFSGTTSRGRTAVRWASGRSYWPTRTCMVFVRTALRVGPRYATPRIAWRAAGHRHRTTFARIPAGVPVYTAGRSAPGHIVLSLGNGMVRSTDWPRPGRVGTVSLSRLLSSWGHRYVGWSEDLNGVRVWHR